MRKDLTRTNGQINKTLNSLRACHTTIVTYADFFIPFVAPEIIISRLYFVFSVKMHAYMTHIAIM